MQVTKAHLVVALIAGLMLGAAGVATAALLRSSMERRGVLIGAVRFKGGPYVPPSHRLPMSGDVVVFSAAMAHARARRHPPYGWFLVGHEVAHRQVRAGHYFRFKLPPGRYKLDFARGSGCRPVTALVKTGRTTRVGVGTGCLIP